MKISIYKSSGVAILVALLCFFSDVIGTQISIAVESNTLKYEQSKLSTAEYEVLEMKNHGQQIGCSAVNRLSSPHIYLTITRDGAGSVSVEKSFVGLNTDNGKVSFQLKLGAKTIKTVGLLDGDELTFPLSKQQFDQANHNSIEVNNVILPNTEVQKIFNLVYVCNSKAT